MRCIISLLSSLHMLIRFLLCCCTYLCSLLTACLHPVLASWITTIVNLGSSLCQTGSRSLNGRNCSSELSHFLAISSSTSVWPYLDALFLFALVTLFFFAFASVFLLLTVLPFEPSRFCYPFSPKDEKVLSISYWPNC